ncbi:MAG: long-chain fatty acid--CoA ligase [Actinobacteria bacterium]|nr:long-chain fatty acid--CoA ligase [Actinomycetota bacterium]
MQEYSTPGEVQVPPSENLTTSLWENERAYPNRPAVAHRVGGRFVDVSTRDFTAQVRDIAKGLIAIGIEPGQRVCVYSATRLEWTLLDYAIWAAGAVTVPIYETSSAEQVEWIVSDSEAVAIFAETAELRATFDEVSGSLPDCEHVFVIDEGGIEEVKSRGADVSDDDVTARATAVTGDDLATIVYTSGTTGRPKGCIITHGNFVWDAAQVEKHLGGVFSAGESTLLFLPLAHIFARVIQVGCVRSGVKLGFSTGIPQLLEELGLFKPTFLLSVPRVFEKVYNGAQQKAHADGKGAIFDKAAQTAIDFSRESRSGKVGLRTKLLHGLFDKLVYGKLRDAMGGRVTYAVSGGAALGERLGHFFNGIGVTILEGYGLTETTAGATLNSPDHVKIGTVGRPIPGTSVRIAEDGEILLKGGNVFQGYYNNEAASEEVLESDGWFHSGDIGELDDEGYLRITGRKKEIIVTAGGKNVAPAVLEDRMRSHPLISQSMVVGDAQPFIAALIAIDSDDFPRWAKEHGKEGKSVSDLVDDPDLRAEIQGAVDNANKAVSKAEAIKAFRILPEDFTIEGGELTPSLKVKRNVVADKYGHVIDDIYSSKKS